MWVSALLPPRPVQTRSRSLATTCRANPDVGTPVSEPAVAETHAHSGPIDGNKAASAPAAKPKAKPRTQSAEATGPAGAAHRVVKPKPKPKPHEVLPWL